MIEFENLQQFTAGLDEWLFECEELADATFRGLAVAALSYIVHGSPQWSGELVSQWKLSVGTPNVSYSPGVYKDLSPSGAIFSEPYSKLSPNVAAITSTIAVAVAEAQHIRLGADVYITNSTPYALEVEENRDHKGKAFIRAVNLPVEMLHAAYDKFSGLGEISEGRAAELIRMAI